MNQSKVTRLINLQNITKIYRLLKSGAAIDCEIQHFWIIAISGIIQSSVCVSPRHSNSWNETEERKYTWAKFRKYYIIKNHWNKDQSWWYLLTREVSSKNILRGIHLAFTMPVFIIIIRTRQNANLKYKWKFHRKSHYARIVRKRVDIQCIQTLYSWPGQL
jgi:hypothetical protein